MKDRVSPRKLCFQRVVSFREKYIVRKTLTFLLDKDNNILLSVVCTNYLSLLCPDCSVCSKGYTPSLGFVCNKCPENANGGTAIIAVMATIVLLAFAAFFSYLFSEEMEGVDQGIAACVTRFIPLQSIKIIIVMWQILTRVSRREHTSLD